MTGQTATRLIEMCLANFPLATKNTDIKKTAALWLMMFKDIADDEMETAIRLCMLNYTNFPTLANIKSAIEDLRADARTQPQLQQLPARSRWTSPAANKAFEMVRVDKAKEYIASMDIADVTEFARSKFPQISDALIRQNYAELATAQKYSVMCWHCRTQPNACLTRGWYMVPVLMPDGYVINEMGKCQKRQKEAESSGNQLHRVR